MGVVAITDDGDCVQSNELMRRACEYAKMFDLPIMDHCQDHSMTVGAVMNEGVMSTRLGLRGWPNAAEDLIVARNAILSEHTGAHIHLQHISSRHSVDIIRRAKARGVKITAEATPHHIALTDESLATYDTHFKMNPPLRTEEDRRAIIAGLRDGTIDIIATDHTCLVKSTEDITQAIAESGRDYAKDIYHRLREEYEYLCSDEMMLDHFDCNDYHFTNEGALACTQ
jgi:dihydroorotase